MTGEPKSGMLCAEFDASLTEAIDGLLEGERLEKFEGHKKECQACALLFQETRIGFEWLHALPEVDPPANLVHNILAVTSAAGEAEPAAEIRLRRGLWTRIRETLVPRLAPLWSPRVAMSFGMAFFSVSMLMSVAGIRISDIGQIDLSRKGIQKVYFRTSGRVASYYDNMRLVYEIETRVRQLKRAARTPEEKKEQETKPSDRGQGPEERREQNYSRQEQEQILALIVKARATNCA